MGSKHPLYDDDFYDWFVREMKGDINMSWAVAGRMQDAWRAKTAKLSAQPVGFSELHAITKQKAMESAIKVGERECVHPSTVPIIVDAFLQAMGEPILTPAQLEKIKKYLRSTERESGDERSRLKALISGIRIGCTERYQAYQYAKEGTPEYAFIAPFCIDATTHLRKLLAYAEEAETIISTKL
jgi:hypothetical protein